MNGPIFSGKYRSRVYFIIIWKSKEGRQRLNTPKQFSNRHASAGLTIYRRLQNAWIDSMESLLVVIGHGIVK